MQAELEHCIAVTPVSGEEASYSGSEHTSPHEGSPEDAWQEKKGSEKARRAVFVLKAVVLSRV